eukprot:1158818-Pelagomonas_calceolata.AAC.11
MVTHQLPDILEVNVKQLLEPGPLDFDHHLLISDGRQVHLCVYVCMCVCAHVRVYVCACVNAYACKAVLLCVHILKYQPTSSRVALQSQAATVTCPREAAAMGCSSNLVNTSSMGRPRWYCTISRAVLESKAGTLSCTQGHQRQVDDRALNLGYQGSLKLVILQRSNLERKEVCSFYAAAHAHAIIH